jgi:GT2 family glycosyltransferase
MRAEMSSAEAQEACEASPQVVCKGNAVEERGRLSALRLGADLAGDPQGRVGVALVNWNGAEFTIPCLQSLLDMTIVPWKIVVVDNASSDGSIERIREAVPGVELIGLSSNLGFAGGTNAAILHLLDIGADYVWVLNNDTIVDKACLELLLREMEGNPSISAISGGILLYDRPDRIWYIGARSRRWTLRAPHDRQGRRWTGRPKGARSVDFLSGCCMLIRREILERIGMFDERFFAYAEDYDWCLRAAGEGARLCVLPEAQLWHRVSVSVRKNTLGESSGTASATAHYLTTRNMLFIVRKHARNPLELVLAAVAHVVHSAVVAGGTALLGRPEKAQAVFRGLRDGFRTPL